MPSRTAVDIAPETVARLFRDVENFVGIKETTKDFEHFSRVIQLLRSRADRLVGHRAALPAVARARRRRVPQRDRQHRARRRTRACSSCWEAGDLEGAREIHYGLHPLVDLLFVETNPAPGKWVLEQRGLIRSGYVRPPLITPTDAGLTKIRALLAEGAEYLTPADDFQIGARA